MMIAGLYAITPDLADTDDLLRRVRAALTGGTGVLQYRNKTASAALRREQAQALQQLCTEFHVPLLINDHLDLALAVDAAGLHLGGDDGDIAAARAQLGPGKLLGASCYDRIELAQKAVAAGADHIAFGSFFASSVKPDAVRPPVDLITRAKKQFRLPVVAIGGITPQNAPQLIAAGVDAVAVISAVFTAPDVAAAAREFQKLFEPRHEKKSKAL
ncbi:MAG: thiamine phosphate synthase [Betaproteobacteria bacterium]